MRLDHLQRPELNKGTVDFLVPDEYWAIEPPPNLNPSYASVGSSDKKQHRPPQPMNYVFAFDISADAVRSGFLKSSCDALRTVLYRETEEDVICKLPAGSKIAIISYDCVINVYKLVDVPPFAAPISLITYRPRMDPELRICSLCQISKMCSCR
jgi:protein transport protein SEC24